MCVLISPGYMPWRGIAGSCGNSMFNHWRNCQNCFPQHLPHFAFTPAVHEGYKFPTSLSTLVTFCLLIVAPLMCVQWYFIVVLIYVFLIAHDVRHLSVCLLAVCISFLRSGYLDLFLFLNRVLFIVEF